MLFELAVLATPQLIVRVRCCVCTAVPAPPENGVHTPVRTCVEGRETFISAALTSRGIVVVWCGGD